MSDTELAQEAASEQDMLAVSPLPRRLLDTFFSPGRMTREMAEHPRWVGALLICMALLALSTWMIPPELFAEVQRRAALERGVDMPPMTDDALRLIHIVSVVGGAVAFALVTFILTGLNTVIFAFVLGDEGRYKQYLTMSVHASVIPALISVPLAPLRVATGDPQFTLNLASFLFFLQDGYLLSVLRFLDLTQIWSTLVMAMGVHAIDRRRSFGSAAAILLAILIGVAMIIAVFVPA